MHSWLYGCIIFIVCSLFLLALHYTLCNFYYDKSFVICELWVEKVLAQAATIAMLEERIAYQ